MLTPKVGDTVILEVKVTTVSSETFTYQTQNGHPSVAVGKCWIKEVIPKPFEVGQTVKRTNDILIDFHYIVLAIHVSITPLITRRWVICSHGDDKPCVFNVSELECVA